MRCQCGKPRIKKKSERGSIHLTNELFQFIRGEDGVMRLLIGSKTKNIGFLSFQAHRRFKLPKSLYITRECGPTASHFVINMQASDVSYDFSVGQKRNKAKTEKHIKRMQKRLARQDRENKKANFRGSNRRRVVRYKIARHHQKVSNIRRDFCHTTSKALVDSTSKVIVLEALNTANMTRRTAVKPDGRGGYLKNCARAKSGLNAAILDKGWHMVETMLAYKTQRAAKALFLVPAHHTSQECTNCSHTHPDNRQTQAKFVCLNCGHCDHADRNASMIIKKRAINLLLDSGTELSRRGMLTLPDKGRGSHGKTVLAAGLTARGSEASKKKIVSSASSTAFAVGSLSL